MSQSTSCWSMSALPPQADIAESDWHVRFVPKADISPLFDHLVSTGEQRGWDGQAKRLSGLEIDHHLEGRRLHDRHVCWPLALEDAAGVHAELVIPGGYAGPVAHQAAG